MPLFLTNKTRAVRTFVLKLVNNNCPELRALADGPRLESRVNLAIAVLVIPLGNRRPQCGRILPAVTKEFSSTGMGVVIHEPTVLEDVIVGVRIDSDMYFVRAKVKHVDAMGAGFCHLGLKLVEMVTPSDYPELRDVSY